jgi:hypothetical protein
MYRCRSMQSPAKSSKTTMSNLSQSRRIGILSAHTCSTASWFFVSFCGFDIKSKRRLSCWAGACSFVPAPLPCLPSPRRPDRRLSFASPLKSLVWITWGHPYPSTTSPLQRVPPDTANLATRVCPAQTRRNTVSSEWNIFRQLKLQFYQKNSLKFNAICSSDQETHCAGWTMKWPTLSNWQSNDPDLTDINQNPKARSINKYN